MNEINTLAHWTKLNADKYRIKVSGAQALVRSMSGKLIRAEKELENTKLKLSTASAKLTMARNSLTRTKDGMDKLKTKIDEQGNKYKKMIEVLQLEVIDKTQQLSNNQNLIDAYEEQLSEMKLNLHDAFHTIETLREFNDSDPLETKFDSSPPPVTHGMFQEQTSLNVGTLKRTQRKPLKVKGRR